MLPLSQDLEAFFAATSTPAVASTAASTPAVTTASTTLDDFDFFPTFDSAPQPQPGNDSTLSPDPFPDLNFDVSPSATAADIAPSGDEYVRVADLLDLKVSERGATTQHLPDTARLVQCGLNG